MTYASIESSSAEGRPYYLYQFVEGDQIWRFTSRATAWTSAGSGGTEINWEPAAVAHGDVVQTSEIERGRLELTWPLSHPFARRFLTPLGNTPMTLTIFRGHEQVLGETVAHWKGRVVGAEVEGQRRVGCSAKMRGAFPATFCGCQSGSVRTCHSCATRLATVASPLRKVADPIFAGAAFIILGEMRSFAADANS